MSNKDAAWLHSQATKTHNRIIDRLKNDFFKDADEGEQTIFLGRLRDNFLDLFTDLYELYGTNYDFYYHLEQLILQTATMWRSRSDELKVLDAIRENDKSWILSNRILGAMCYVDLFSEDLAGLREKIPYLKELGITYLHLMPLFKSPDNDNDGGYAISSYRDVNPNFGTMDELVALTNEFRRHGISLCLDFVFNHTSDEHKWAKATLASDTENYVDFYRTFSDRKLPDQYEKTLGEIFPDEHPGAFTYRPRIKKWVWTSFYSYQWDLNYENPAVFNAMAGEMLFLANLGVEILRLDAIAFVWKRLGTSCENLEEAHTLVRAFRAIKDIACPAVEFKSEAIVHPDQVQTYINKKECRLSYNPNLMALLWSTIATGNTKLLNFSLEKRFHLDPDCAWVNYVRCHDDIGWAFSNEDCASVGIDGDLHRRYLSAFFTGGQEDSYAKGLPFQKNAETGDMRVSGSLTSLCGLEWALEKNDEKEIDLAIKRVLLLNGIIITIGGVPMIYLGDEMGALNNYSFLSDKDKSIDSRWVHRSCFPWHLLGQRDVEGSVTNRIYTGIMKITQIRSQNMAFTRAATEFMDTENESVLAYFRHHGEHIVLVIANFSDSIQAVSGRKLRQRGLKRLTTDLISGKSLDIGDQVELQPYQFSVLLGVR